MVEGPVNMCTGPIFDCDQAPHATECEAMRNEFITDSSNAIWIAARREPSPFAICVQLQKCSDDENSKACKEALKKPECELKPECEATKVCSSICYTCYRLINEWPIFQETCKPPGANMADEVQPPPPAPLVKLTSDPISFVEQQGMQSNYLTYDDEQFLRIAASGAVSFNSREHAERAHRVQRAMESGLLSENQLRMIAEAAATSDLVRHSSFLELNSQTSRYVDASELESDHDYDPQADSPEFSSSNIELLQDGAFKGLRARARRQPEFRGGFDTSLIQKTCYNMWDELRESRRARYFMTYKRTTMPELDFNDLASGYAWDAHSVCKCLKMCPMQQGESLELVQICRYNKMQDLLMRTAFPHLPKM